MQTAALEGGFDDPSVQSAQAFRGIMEAMARPGRIFEIAGACPPPPLSAAAGTVLLTLCDATTPIHLAGDYDTPAVRQWLAFHTSAPCTTAQDCDFALGSWEDLMPLQQYRVGTAEYPDRSATLIVDMPLLAPKGAVLRGPGIKETAQLSLPDVKAMAESRRWFPLGLDFILTCGDQVAALPRSVEVNGCM